MSCLIKIYTASTKRNVWVCKTEKVNKALGPFDVITFDPYYSFGWWLECRR